ncbi:hypothetical protein [Microbacterium sp. G2-8]|nr:hypothetical protein [Microbacterium sp. G2-8]
MCDAGVTVDYREVPGDHGPSVPNAAAELPGWFDARFAGEEAGLTC